MRATKNVGTCRLCLKTGVELLDGHIIPRWAYLRASLHRVPGRTEKKNPNPYALSSDSLVQTSRQVTEYMLCANCEQRFSIDETYASKLAYQPDGMQIPECELGKYGDDFRRYLSGDAQFPLSAAIVLRFLEDWPRMCHSKMRGVSTFPSSRTGDGYHLHTLVICAMQFEIAVGRCIPNDNRGFCLVRGSQRCLIIDSASILRQHAGRLRRSALEATRLRRLPPRS